MESEKFLDESTTKEQNEQINTTQQEHEKIIALIEQRPKAGLENIDKNHVNKIIYEMSKGSKFFENQEKHKQQIYQRIEEMKKKLLSIIKQKSIKCPNDTIQVDQLSIEDWKKVDWSVEENIIAQDIIQLEKSRDLSSIWIHIDMDAYYISVEMRDNPSLKNLPCAVGGNHMITTANYEARKYGVRSAMPGFIAKALCPSLILIKPNFEKYKKVSEEIQNIFREYDPNFIPISLDEANLNVTNYLKRKCKNFTDKDGELLAEEIRKKIFEKTGLTASAGIAANRMLSKICSDINKPNGQFALPRDSLQILEFMKKLPIRKIPGNGPVTETILNEFGIYTCKDLLDSMCLIKCLFSKYGYKHFLASSMGIAMKSKKKIKKKSISKERTFKPSNDKNLFISILDLITTNLEEDLNKYNPPMKGKTITLKNKMSDFKVLSRSITITDYTNCKKILFQTAKELLDEELKKYLNQFGKEMQIRLLGIRMSNFINELSNQKSILEMFPKKDNQNKDILDEIYKDQKNEEKKRKRECTNNINSLQKMYCPSCKKNIEYDGSKSYIQMKHNIHIKLCSLSPKKKQKTIDDWFSKKRK